jgi:hypothetical protein
MLSDEFNQSISTLAELKRLQRAVKQLDANDRSIAKGLRDLDRGKSDLAKSLRMLEKLTGIKYDQAFPDRSDLRDASPSA